MHHGAGIRRPLDRMAAVAVETFRGVRVAQGIDLTVIGSCVGPQASAWQLPQFRVITSLLASITGRSMSWLVWQSEHTAAYGLAFHKTSSPCTEVVYAASSLVWHLPQMPESANATWYVLHCLWDIHSARRGSCSRSHWCSIGPRGWDERELNAYTFRFARPPPPIWRTARSCFLSARSPTCSGGTARN